MAGHIGYTVANEIYEFIYRDQAITIGPSLWLRLLVEPSSRSGGGTETNYAGYARYEIVRGTSVFAATANGRIASSIVVAFPSPGDLGNGNLVFFDIVDTASGAFSKIYNAGPILPARVIEVGKPPKFKAGALVSTL